MEVYNRIKVGVSRMFHNKVFLSCLALITTLALVGALVLFSISHPYGSKGRGLDFRSFALTTDTTIIPVTTTVIPITTISVFYLTNTSIGHTPNSGLITNTRHTLQTAFTTLTASKVASSGDAAPSSINTASLAGIFVGIVFACLIIGTFLLYISRRMDRTKSRFWPIGARTRARGTTGPPIRLQRQNISHVPSQAIAQTTPANDDFHAEFQIDTHQASQIAINAPARTVLSSLPEIPAHIVPQITVSPASGSQAVDEDSLAKIGTGKDAQVE